ncbi:MAG: glycosyltransferase family 4 protein [Thermoleophilia bacterium]|nr:glycosyltransferase family 4 protein [Thermoleophilia bacterium]
MKVLQVVRQFHPGTGGMENYVSCLCRELTSRGHRSDVATLDYLFKTRERLPAYGRSGSIDIIRLPSAGNARYFLAPRLLELLPRYDLVHVHGVDFFTDLLGFLRRVHARPVVLSTHGGFFHTDWFLSFKKAYFFSVTRMALRGVDRIIGDSPRDAELFSRVSSRVTMVENGIDYRRFSAVQKKIQPDTLLFVGRISRNKRIDRLIEALARLKEDRPGMRLVVAGPDWEGLQGRLEQQAGSLGVREAVSFTGVLPPDELLEEFARARLFVSASEYEAFGLSTVEAMAAATVPVVNSIRAFADIVEDGETGFLTDFSDVEAAAGTLRRALELADSGLLEMGEKAREAASRYDWRRVAGNVIQVYEEVLE